MAEPRPPDNIITTELSSDIPLFYILPRLPVKSLLRFTCVSKQWHSFLTRSVFAKIVTNDHRQNHHKLLVLSTTRPYKFQSIDCETPEDGFTPSRPVPFKVGPRQNISILTSLHGMVCVGITERNSEGVLWNRYAAEYSDLILWNPFTNDYKTLSKPSSHKGCYKTLRGGFGLYYSSSDDDCKLLCLTYEPYVYIYSLKTDSWRKVKSTKGFQKRTSIWRLCDWKTSVLLNENLYFLEEVYGENHSYLIMMFDTKTEQFKEIATPPSENQKTDCRGFMMVVRGCIHLCVAFLNLVHGFHTIELWRMDGDEDWTKVVTYSSLEHFSWQEQPLHIMRNGNWLMHCEGYVYQRDMQSDTNDKISSYNSLDIRLGSIYMETIVSPNQYMK